MLIDCYIHNGITDVQVVCSETGSSQPPAANYIAYKECTDDYSTLFKGLKLGGTYSITIFAMSNGKSIVGATQQHTLGDLCIYYIV